MNHERAIGPAGTSPTIVCLTGLARAVVVGCSVLLFAGLAPAAAPKSAGRKTPVVHHVRLAYATLGQTKAILQNLVERPRTGGQSAEFYGETKSVYCADGQCREVMVRIYWDELGGYLRFELPAGTQLEKTAGAPFTKTGCPKLDQILRDRDSPLKDMTLITLQDDRDTGTQVDAVATGNQYERPGQKTVQSRRDIPAAVAHAEKL